LKSAASGGKTYALRYKDDHGRQIQHKIGDAKSISFDKAKNAAQVIRSRVVLGEDPAAELRTKRLVPTLAAFIEERPLPYAKAEKRSWLTDVSYLKCHILPRFGAYYLDKITQQEVIEFHHGMKANGFAMATANKALVLLKYALNLALRWGIPGFKSNPAIGVKLYEANNAREKFFTQEETQRLHAELQKSVNPQLRHMVALLLLLGCRKREMLDSSWSDFDLDRRSWKIH